MKWKKDFWRKILTLSMCFASFARFYFDLPKMEKREKWLLLVRSKRLCWRNEVLNCLIYLTSFKFDIQGWISLLVCFPANSQLCKSWNGWLELNEWWNESEKEGNSDIKQIVDWIKCGNFSGWGINWNGTQFLKKQKKLIFLFLSLKIKLFLFTLAAGFKIWAKVVPSFSNLFFVWNEVRRSWFIQKYFQITFFSPFLIMLCISL